jgi:hypothetical protein
MCVFFSGVRFSILVPLLMEHDFPTFVTALLGKKGSWGLAHPMSLTELALLDGRRPLPLGDLIGLTLTLNFIR